MRKVAGKPLGPDRLDRPIPRRPRREPNERLGQWSRRARDAQPDAWHRPWEWMGRQQGVRRQPRRRVAVLDFDATYCGRCSCNSLASPSPPSHPPALRQTAAESPPLTKRLPEWQRCARGGGGMAGMPETRVFPGRPAKKRRGRPVTWCLPAQPNQRVRLPRPLGFPGTEQPLPLFRRRSRVPWRSAESGRAGAWLSLQPVPLSLAAPEV